MKFVDAVDGNEGSTIRNYENTDQKVSTLFNRHAVISPANDEFALASGWRICGLVVLDRNNFYHVLWCRAQYCYNKSSLSVCLSVCLWHWGIVVTKVGILQKLFMADVHWLTSLCITDLPQREHPKIFAGIGVGCGKSGFWHAKSCNISEMGLDSKVK